MNTGFFISTLQIVIAVGLLNVWLVRFNKTTAFRGGDAKNLVEEFSVYGLSPFFCYTIGALKVGSAVLLLLGLKFSSLVHPVAALVTVLMLGAVLMHAKVKDPIQKALPASLMLIMSFIVFLNS